MINRISVVVLYAFIFALFTQVNQVHACTQPPEPIPTAVTLEERVNNAPIILVGQVAGYDDETGYNFIAEVQVERYLKGEGTSPVQISGFGYSSMCLTGVSEGSRYIFFVQPDGETLRGIYFQGYAPVMIPSDENIDAIVAITGQSTLPAVSADTVSETTDKQTSGFPIAIIIWLYIMAIIIGLELSRAPRKKKAKRE